MSALLATPGSRVSTCDGQGIPMNRRSLFGQFAAALAACCGLWMGAVSATAGDKGKPAGPEGRNAIGQLASPAGSLLVCGGGKKDCRALKERADVSAGDHLLALPGLRGDVDLAKGAVRLSLLGHVPEKGNSAVLESAATLRAPGTAALDFTLDRGRVLVTNRAARGSVKVRVHLLKEQLALDLAEPGSTVALELVSQWPAGAPFVKEPKADHQPVVDGFLFVVKGPVNVRLSDGTEQNGLRTGVVYHWNSLRGVIGPLTLKELPAWARGAAPKGQAAETLARLRQLLAQKDVASALADALRDQQVPVRALAVYALATVGDLPPVLKTLAESKDRAVSGAAVTALRHWSGLGPAHDERLYEALMRDGYKPVQAEVVVGLLHGFSRADLDRRETYETLIDYLTHDRPAVRQLAAWQLYRVVPDAAAITYDPLGPQEQRARAQAAWRKLLRAGKLPPAGSSK
jgi:hypothetical protein